MKLAIAQIKSVLGGFEQNMQKHQEFIRKGIEQKAELIIFPELSLTGYSLKDLTNEVAVRVDDPRLNAAYRPFLRYRYCRGAGRGIAGISLF